MSWCAVRVKAQAFHQLVQVCLFWPRQCSAALAESDYQAAGTLQCQHQCLCKSQYSGNAAKCGSYTATHAANHKAGHHTNNCSYESHWGTQMLLIHRVQVCWLTSGVASVAAEPEEGAMSMSWTLCPGGNELQQSSSCHNYGKAFNTAAVTQEV